MAFQEVWSVRHGFPPLLDLGSWGGLLGVAGIAFLLGLLALCRLKRDPWWERTLLRLSAGVVLAPLAALLFGQIPGALAALPWGLFGLAGWIALLVSLARARRSPGIPRSSTCNLQSAIHNPQSAIPGLLGWVVVGLALALRLIPAVCPPLAYDTLEYHMGIIPHVIQTGLYRPIPHIFYSAQPQSAEALYTLAALIEGTAWGFAPGLTHWGLIALLVPVAAQVLRLLGSPPAWRPWLILLYLNHPLVMRLQVDRMSDWFGVLMLACGVWAYLSADVCIAQDPIPNHDASARRNTALAWCAIIGLFIGGGVGSKWTHAGTVAVPLAMLALGLGWDASKKWSGAAAGAAVAGFLGFLIWLPWGAWLWAVRGNPFAPFLAGLFPTADWPPERLHFLLQAHDPLSFFEKRYWITLVRRLALETGDPPLIVLGLAGALVLALVALGRKTGARESAGRTAFVIRLALGMVVALLLWGKLAQSADRFLAPLLLGGLLLLTAVLLEMLAWLPRRGSGRLARILGPLLLLAFAFVGGRNEIYNILAFRDAALGRAMVAHALGRIDRYEYLYSHYGEEIRVVRAANALGPQSRILALNDARRYLYTGRIDTASVFDASPIRPHVTGAANGEEIRARLRRAGYTHVLFNGFEQVRILRMQTPLRLLRDPKFQEILSEPDRGRGDWQLARTYWGMTEFSVDPLTASERIAYGEFLSAMQRQASTIVPAGFENPAPSFWLSPLD